jgi:hypothetical protein
MHNTERLAAHGNLNGTRLHGQIDLRQQLAAREIPNAYGTIIIRYCDSRAGRICRDERRYPGDNQFSNNNALLQ